MLSIYQKILSKRQDLIGCAYDNIGNVYIQKMDYDLALYNLEQALKVKTEAGINNEYSIAKTYQNLGCLYSKFSQFEKGF